MKKRKLIWLDDRRDPSDGSWVSHFSPISRPFEIIWLKSYDEFIEWIAENGLPDAICFDHDLGLPNQLKWRAKGKSKKEARRLAKLEEKTGHDCAKWLVNYCLDNNLQLPIWNVQSDNPSGKDNINGLLFNFKEKVLHT